MTITSTTSPFAFAAAADMSALATNQSALRTATQEAAQKALQEAASLAERIATLQTEIASLQVRIAAMTAEKEYQEVTTAALRTQLDLEIAARTKSDLLLKTMIDEIRACIEGVAPFPYDACWAAEGFAREWYGQALVDINAILTKQVGLPTVCEHIRHKD